MVPQAVMPETSDTLSWWDGREGKTEAPEEEDSCRFADLVVGQNVSKLLGDVANAFDNGI
jgi:hypothetical protein